MWRVFIKDIRELAAAPMLVVFLVVWPCVVLVVAKSITDYEPRVSLYVDHANNSFYPHWTSVVGQLRDIPEVEIVDRDRRGRSVWDFLAEEKIDGALIWHDPIFVNETPVGWILYINPKKEHMKPLLISQNNT